VVDHTGRFFFAFLAAACFSLFGAMNFVLGVGPIREVTWPARIRAAEEAEALAKYPE